MNTTTNTVEKLVKFVNQRAGLQYCNYGDIKSYRQEQREITNDRTDFYELLSVAQRRYEGQFNEVLTKELQKTSGRLTLNEHNNIEYCTGQYFCTEYRPAACRIIVSLIWNSYMDEKNESNLPTYKDGNEIRKAIKRNFSRRINKNLFN